MSRRRIVFPVSLLLAFSAAAAPAPAAEFGANHLLYTTADDIREIDYTTGEVVQVLELAGNVNPCFLPNGNLLVLEISEPSALSELEPDGTLVRKIEFDSEDGVPQGMAAGPNGRLFVQTDQKLLVLSLTSGEVEQRFELAGKVNPDWHPSGHLWIASGNQILEVDPNFGTVVRGIAFGALESVTGFAPHPNGSTLVTTVASPPVVRTFDSLSLTGHVNPDFLPNGRLALFRPSDGRLFEVDLETEEVVGERVLEGATSIALVPFRFQAQVTGTLARSEIGRVKLTEAPASLLLRPNSRRIVLSLGSAPSHLPATFGETLVLRGFEGFKDDAATPRLFEGAQVPRAGSLDEAQASISVNAKGKLGAGGFLELTQGSGNLEIGLGSSVFSGKITTVSLLNP